MLISLILISLTKYTFVFSCAGGIPSIAGKISNFGNYVVCLHKGTLMYKLVFLLKKTHSVYNATVGAVTNISDVKKWRL